MFGNKKIDTTAPTISSGALNSLVQGTTVEGSIRAESDIRIDGSIKGDLTCSAKVIIGPTGSIQGEVKCVNAIIEGKFEGILFVEELLTVKETAHIVGDIQTGKLIVNSGAVFNVTCGMGKTTTKSASVSKEQPQVRQQNPLSVG